MRLIYYLILLCGLTAASQVSNQRLGVREIAAKAAAGDPKALYDLAMLHDMGYDSIPVDSARSTALYRLSADHGYPPAQNYLGFRYFNGEAVRQDVDSALYWMAKAAGNGDMKAANNLGYLLANSDKVTRDYPQALYWLSKAAGAGLPAGMSQLADLYRHGLGCDPDTARAETLYMQAIQRGLHDAELKLLSMKGHQWLSLSPDSALSLGKYHYTHGAPVIGVTLFENAAAYHPTGYDHKTVFAKDTHKGNSATTLQDSSNYRAATKALALLGDAYSRGLGVAYDHDRSVALYREAALRGEHSAEFVIAELLEIFPDAVDFDLPEQRNAPYWYDRAAAGGVTDAATATSRLLD